jgi:putative transposase
VESIGNANEEAVRKYVQNQLVELDSKEKHANQLGLLSQ